MYWQESSEHDHYQVPDDVIDVRFRIKCASVPMDHAWALFEQISNVLPWFAEEAFAGLHIIHGADSGNGWERPQDPNEPLYLSARTRLALRVPKHRQQETEALAGKTLDIAGSAMAIGEPSIRLLSDSPTLYSRYVANEGGLSEEEFIEWAVSELRTLNLSFKKVLSGKTSSLSTPEGKLPTRTLMISDLSKPDAIRLQQHGVGPRRAMGCGLFIPQKTV